MIVLLHGLCDTAAPSRFHPDTVEFRSVRRTTMAHIPDKISVYVTTFAEISIDCLRHLPTPQRPAQPAGAEHGQGM